MSDPTPTSRIPAPLAALLAKARTVLGSLSRPAKVMVGSTTAFALLFLGYLGYQQSHETYAVLFSQLDQDDAAAIVAKLKELKTPFRLEGGGGTVEVPESKVGEVRLELASAGMPRGGGVGFESFDKMRLGATEFEQRVLYRRALEGELARTIGTLGAVQSARVHLVLPEKSVFVSRAEPASASIVLKLRLGRALGGSEVSGIVHLAAASVPGLTADRVALVTTDGEMLKKPRGGESGTSALDNGEEQSAYQRTVESQLEDRTRAMLEKVVGPGHVDVRVTADIDSASVEHTEDHYDPARTALRSEETSMERSWGTVDDSVAGVPGAESNLPNGAATGGATTPASTATARTGDAGAPKPTGTAALAKSNEPFRESHTRNFEVDHVSDKRVIRSGTVRRLTAAVVLDGVVATVDGKSAVVPRDKAELERLASLVRSAVGASDTRGDVVTVESVPFAQDAASLPAEAAPPSPAVSISPLLTKLTRGSMRYALAAGGALIVLLVLVVALRGRRAKKAREATVELLAPAAEVEQLEPGTSPEALRAAALERAAKDPATAALVVRFWLGTGDAEPKAAAGRALPAA